MISDSVPLMTAIDLLILAVTVYGIWRYRLISPGKRFERPRIGLLLSNSGLLAVALFYAADLAIMHVLPMVTARDEAMKAMDGGSSSQPQLAGHSVCGDFHIYRLHRTSRRTPKTGGESTSLGRRQHDWNHYLGYRRSNH